VTKLVCPDCQHENEAERVYCHNCGARLEHGALLEEKVAKEDAGARSRKHLQKMLRPGRGRGKLTAIKFGKLLLGALSLAVVIQMILPPDLPPQPKAPDFAPMINMDLVSALSSHSPAQLVYNEEQVNAYLASTVRRSNSPAREGFFPLRRIFVKFEDGLCAINIERQFVGLSIYGGSAYRVSIENGKIVSASANGYIGRMPIHPALLRGLDLLFGKAWDTLARERNGVAKLAGIEFHPQSVTLLTVR
jgi:hypothetical protein